MKYQNLLTLLSLGLAATASPLTQKRGGSNSWAGTSNYFVHGMSNSDQQAYLKTLSDAGIKIIRLWVSGQPGGNSCVKGSTSVSGCSDLETTIGSYNDEVLDLLDQTLVFAQAVGIKAIISPHDGNDLGGANGNDIYGQTYGSGDFYEDSDAITAYDNRLKHILAYTGKYSGKVWSSYSDAIAAFDIENEAFSAKTSECTSSPGEDWPCGRAQTLRTALGDSNPIKVATGGLGGDISHGCTFISPAMQCDQIDLVSVHRYAGPESSNQGQWSGAYPGYISSANNKLVYIEEWGVDTNSYNPDTEFPANTEDMNGAGLPWSYWQLLPSQTCSSNDMDGFGFFVDSGVPWQQQAQNAAQASCPQDWSGIV